VTSEGQHLFRLIADGFDRLALPKQLSSRIPWLSGDQPLKAWLVLISAGRYRLLSDDQVGENPHFESLRSLIMGTSAGGASDPAIAQEDARSALTARLLSVVVSPPKPAWRVSLPKAIKIFEPPNCDTNDFTILLAADGHWEIWYTDVLRAAAFLPLFVG
jgi:hypothetical protein